MVSKGAGSFPAGGPTSSSGDQTRPSQAASEIPPGVSIPGKGQHEDGFATLLGSTTPHAAPSGEPSSNSSALPVVVGTTAPAEGSGGMAGPGTPPWSGSSPLHGPLLPSVGEADDEGVEMQGSYMVKPGALVHQVWGEGGWVRRMSCSTNGWRGALVTVC